MHFQRSPATHVFVFMVSSESRSKKPYSLPVQCIPYAGLIEVELRRLINDLCKEMISLGTGLSVMKNLFFCVQRVIHALYLCCTFVEQYEICTAEGLFIRC